MYGLDKPLGMAAADLGLGDMLRGQLGEETEEQKRKRLQMKQDAQASMSPAAQQLFGTSNAAAY